MKYIEENLRVRPSNTPDPDQIPRPASPSDELYRMPAAAAQKPQKEPGGPNSLAMLTAIPEVDLGMA